MQFLSDDSTEWMRKAAEDYPVKPFGSNWEAVARQLPDETPGKWDRGYALMRYAAMVVFFMLLSLVCNKYLQFDFHNRYAATAVSSNKQQHTDAAPPEAEGEGSLKTGQAVVLSTNRYKAGTVDNAIAVPIPEKLMVKAGGAKQTMSSNQNPPSLISSVPGLESKITTPGEWSLSVPPTGVLESRVMQEAVVVVNTPQESGESKGFVAKRRLYAGLMVGPDISSVKFQKSDGVGFNLGLLVGYRLSAKWQVESGILLNRKEYYSNGEYFNAGSTYLPTHAYITNVNGYCTMFEIPVNMRYNITQKSQGRWFAVAGVSSYLMNKEDYNYTYKRYNVEYKGNKVNRDLSKEWLTVINASIGYEKAISEKVQIRLEPYIKLPLRGMGTGKLPISSTGMNVGISYPIK